MDGMVRAWMALGFLLVAGSLTAQEVLPPLSPRPHSPTALPASEDDALETLPPLVYPKKEEKKTDAPPACDACGFDWKKVPPIHVFHRPGFFPVPPKGPGCYSLWDCVHGECSKDRPKFGYLPTALQPPPMFDIDWRYLEDPKTPPQDWLESLHRIHLGDAWLLNTGGEVRWRHTHETNSRLAGVTNDYDLTRTRVYGDLWYQDRFRVFVEYLDAHSFNHDLPPAVPDVNRSDFLNAFIEMKVWDDCNGKGYVRGGRQELLFGSQRLISPPDWLNARRTFNGVRGYYQSEKWDVDLFWAQPVIPHPSHIDSIDDEQHFAGAWVTYRPEKGQFRDFYYLMLDNDNTVRQLGLDRSPYTVHTVGTRWAGDKDHWLYDVEAMFQFGNRGDQSILAGSFTGGLGYHFECLPMNPTVWAYYDYASGDHSPNSGSYNTFNQLFPFAHYYMGWVDVVARQNVHDLNGHLYLYPTKWLTVNLQYHHFELVSRRDALYADGGAAIRRSANGSAGRHVGDEVDLIVNLHLSRRSDILLGYSHLWAGNFLERTGPGQDASLWYFMYNFRW